MSNEPKVIMCGPGQANVANVGGVGSDPVEMEPGADTSAKVSIAISLKRIADALDKIESALRFQAELIYSADRR